MLIGATMDLSQLQERMGDAATQGDAEVMRVLLVGQGYKNTADVPTDVWHANLEMSARLELDQGD